MRLTRRALMPMVAGAGVLAMNTTIAPGQTGAQGGGTPGPEAGSGTIAYDLPGDAVYPEGVAFDPTAGVFYVGSTATGTIFRGDLATGEVTTFAEGAEQGLAGVTGMKVDASGLLWVCGASTGLIAIYDTTDGSVLGVASNGLGPEETFVNDVAVTSDGVGYFTDSVAPRLTAVGVQDGEFGEPETISFEGTAYTYGEGFNANGIVLTDDGAHLIIVDSGTASLYRYTIETGEVSLIDTAGADLTAGDGMALDGDLLYVCRNAVGQITRLRLSGDHAAATFVDEFSDPAFAFPTTIALTDRETLLVCNSQFGAMETGSPTLPFTVIEIAVPPLAADDATPEAGGTPVVEAGTGQDQDQDNATPVATPTT